MTPALVKSARTVHTVGASNEEPRAATFIHADLDAFFASVEIALNPAVGAHPMAVVSGSRGVVLSASYRARAFGVRAGMPLALARRSCPSLVAVPARLPAYRAVGEAVASVLASAGGHLDRLSIDEVSWEIPSTTHSLPGVDTEHLGAELGAWARRTIREQFGLPLSVGVASSRIVAKVACTDAKPDGLTVVPSGQERHYLAGMGVERIPGVGPATLPRLHELGISTVSDLAGAEKAALERVLGKASAARLMEAASGRDVPSQQPRSRSLGVEHSFETPEPFKDAFERLAGEALARLRRSGLSARGATVTWRAEYAAGRVTRSATLAHPVSDLQLLKDLAARAVSVDSPGLVTLLGVSFTDLNEHPQQLLDLAWKDPLPPLELPDLPEPTLLESVYAGATVMHGKFGAGRVLGMRDGCIAVRFPDRMRILDPTAPVVHVVKTTPPDDGNTVHAQM